MYTGITADKDIKNTPLDQYLQIPVFNESFINIANLLFNSWISKEKFLNNLIIREPMNVAVLGSGISGLGIAYRLAKNGVKVTLIEKSNELGGLASSFKINGYSIEKFYHVIQQKDKIFLNLLKELGLDDKIIWREISTGFYFKNKIYKLNTPIDLLFFKPLPFFERIKFGYKILQVSNIRDWKSLDKVNAKDWLIREWGKGIYKNLFEPLLKTKFGVSIDNASAAFVFGRVRAASVSKSKKVGKEKYAYISGGYQQFIDKFEESIKNLECNVMKNTKVLGLYKNGKNYKISVKKEGRVEFLNFDLVVNTLPLNLFPKILQEFPNQIYNQTSRIKYQGVICLLLGLRKKLCDCWWVNILDENLPFGVVVEHTNLGGCNQCTEHIIYLAKYLPPTDDIFNKTDEEIETLYTKKLNEIFPNFHPEDIAWWKLSRSKVATPLFDVNFFERMPSDKLLDGLYTAGSYKVYPDSRNLNEILKHSFDLSERIMDDINIQRKVF